MPTLGELRSRYPGQTTDNGRHSGEEFLVADARALLRPAQMVEEKLRTVLQANAAASLSKIPTGITGYKG
jgi:hypothetical protein